MWRHVEPRVSRQLRLAFGGEASADLLMQPDKNATVSALLGVAALLTLVGLLGWLMYSPLFGWFDWIVTASGGIYLGLAMVARRARLVAALSGVVLFGMYLGYQASLSVDLLWHGWLIKAPIAVLLLISLIFALRVRRK